ncbi:MAG: hypothetical protein WBH01_05975 [Dehalococcoidia bacterium]
MKTRENLTDFANTKVKLGDLYDRVLENLQCATPETKALALDTLDMNVYARGTDGVEIQGVIPLELASLTTAQTSASLFRCRYSYIKGKGYALSRA